jgi:hypothetical protein
MNYEIEPGECILPFMVPSLTDGDLRRVLYALMDHLDLCVDVTQREDEGDRRFTARKQ